MDWRSPLNEEMAKAYSDDLRCKLLEAYEAGAGSLRKLAAQFRVSWGFAKKIRGQQLATGQKERPPQKHRGPISRITAALQENLRKWLREQPDLTEAELQERLVREGVQVTPSRVGQVLRQMGLRRKKNRFTPRSGTAKPTASGARNFLPTSPRSRRRS
jgi:transposase